jgi:hypothetical protein
LGVRRRIEELARECAARTRPWPRRRRCWCLQAAADPFARTLAAALPEGPGQRGARRDRRTPLPGWERAARQRRLRCKRFALWIVDSASANDNQAWLDCQYEIGLRPHRIKKNRTDGANSVPQVHFRYLPALTIPLAHPLERRQRSDLFQHQLVQHEFVWRLHLGAERIQDFLGRVLLVPRHDCVGTASYRSRRHVTVIRVRQT